MSITTTIKGKQFLENLKKMKNVLGSKALLAELLRAFNPCQPIFDKIGYKNAIFLEQCKFQLADYNLVIEYRGETAVITKHERNGKKSLEITFRAKTDNAVCRNVYPAKGKAKTNYLLGLMDFIIDDMRRWYKIHKLIKESDTALDHMSRSTHYEAYKEEMEKGTLNIVETKV